MVYFDMYLVWLFNNNNDVLWIKYFLFYIIHDYIMLKLLDIGLVSMDQIL